jgi:dienelactone hydrolase
MEIRELNDWPVPRPGRALSERQRQAGLDVTHVAYPRVYHGFDNPLLGSGKRRVVDARGGRGATAREKGTLRL